MAGPEACVCIIVFSVGTAAIALSFAIILGTGISSSNGNNHLVDVEPRYAGARTTPTNIRYASDYHEVRCRIYQLGKQCVSRWLQFLSCTIGR